MCRVFRDAAWRRLANPASLLWLGTVVGGATVVEATTPVEELRLEVVAEHPHDRSAFTQGLVWSEGQLLESTGGYGGSSLRRIDLATGRILQSASLPAELFGEGLAVVGDRLVQLTWRENKALVWDRDRFEPLDELGYGGEGWGLCFDGERLVMSDGTSTLFFREVESFAEIGRVRVTLGGRPVARLNELECVEGRVWANVWVSEKLVRIDPATGRVDAVVDASGLLDPAERKGTDVLNGIAHRPETGTFLLTGKLWPKIFEVRFVENATRGGRP